MRIGRLIPRNLTTGPLEASLTIERTVADLHRKGPFEPYVPNLSTWRLKVPKLIPITVVPNIVASRSDMLDFRWSSGMIRATFVIPDNSEQELQVSFSNQCIVRILDEMPLSTEIDDSANEGLVPEHFAYRVEDALFFRTQSEAWKCGIRSPVHYRFITGWTCLDVVTSGEPSFAVVAIAPID
jgi:hypothetical protein